MSAREQLQQQKPWLLYCIVITKVIPRKILAQILVQNNRSTAASGLILLVSDKYHKIPVKFQFPSRSLRVSPLVNGTIIQIENGIFDSSDKTVKIQSYNVLLKGGRYSVLFGTPLMAFNPDLFLKKKQHLQKAEFPEDGYDSDSD